MGAIDLIQSSMTGMKVKLWDLPCFQWHPL